MPQSGRRKEQILATIASRGNLLEAGLDTGTALADEINCPIKVLKRGTVFLQEADAGAEGHLQRKHWIRATGCENILQFNNPPTDDGLPRNASERSHVDDPAKGRWIIAFAFSIALAIAARVAANYLATRWVRTRNLCHVLWARAAWSRKAVVEATAATKNLDAEVDNVVVPKHMERRRDQLLSRGGPNDRLKCVTARYESSLKELSKSDQQTVQSSFHLTFEPVRFDGTHYIEVTDKKRIGTGGRVFSDNGLRLSRHCGRGLRSGGGTQWTQHVRDRRQRVDRLADQAKELQRRRYTGGPAGNDRCVKSQVQLLGGVASGPFDSLDVMKDVNRLVVLVLLNEGTGMNVVDSHLTYNLCVEG